MLKILWYSKENFPLRSSKTWEKRITQRKFPGRKKQLVSYSCLCLAPFRTCSPGSHRLKKLGKCLKRLCQPLRTQDELSWSQKWLLELSLIPYLTGLLQFKEFRGWSCPVPASTHTFNHSPAHSSPPFFLSVPVHDYGLLGTLPRSQAKPHFDKLNVTPQARAGRARTASLTSLSQVYWSCRHLLLHRQHLENAEKASSCPNISFHEGLKLHENIFLLSKLAFCLSFF